MLRSIHSLRWASLSLCASSLLAACGGGPDGAAGGGAAPAPPTTLSVSASELALKVSGNARSFTITNTGGAAALSVIYSVSPALPAGSTSLSTCGTLAPGASCTITVTPGATASALKGITNPVPITFNVGGVNTNIASVSVHVLEYGSVYQSGYVFDFDDTTPATGSIGGKAAGLNDASAFAVQWSGSLDNVPGSDSSTDGAANTQAVVTFYSPGVPATTYAAGICSESSDGGYADWYLPAICEMGYDRLGAGSGCGTGAAPLLQNMQSNLIDNGGVAGLPPVYWSSTQVSALPVTSAWAQEFSLPGGSQFNQNKALTYPLRCVRALTL